MMDPEEGISKVANAAAATEENLNDPNLSQPYDQAAFQAPQAQMMGSMGNGTSSHDGNRPSSPVDSEAETEISKSQNPTPMKPTSSRDVDNPRKRKAATGSMHDGSRSDYENQEDEDDDSDLEPTHRRRKTAKLVRTHESMARSQSPPAQHHSLRQSHRRASSQHSPLAGPELTRRLRPGRRRQTSEDHSEHENAASAGIKKRLDPSGRTKLARACNDGDLEEAQNQLALHPLDLDRADYAKNTPLQMAAVNGHVELVEWLIQRGADVNNVNVDGDTPYKDAVDNDHEEVIKVLLENKADPTLTGRKEGARERFLYANITLAALTTYCKNSDIEGVDYCLKTGVNPNTACTVIAASSGNWEILNLLLAFGSDADPDPATNSVNDHSTPMLAAIGNGQFDVVRQLLRKDGFNRDRVIGGRDYVAVAEHNRSRNWQRVVDVIREHDRSIEGEPVHDDIKLDGEASSPDATEINSTAGVAPSSRPSDDIGMLKREEDSPERTPKKFRETQATQQTQSTAEAEAEERDRQQKAAMAEAEQRKQEQLAVEEEAARREAQKAEEKARLLAEQEALRLRTEEDARLAAEQAALEEENKRQALIREENDRQEARTSYLAGLPRALSKMLHAGPQFPISRLNDWSRGLDHYKVIYGFFRKELEPLCETSLREDCYMPGWQASILLGHHRLDEICPMVEGHIAMTPKHRQKLFRHLPMFDWLSVDANWVHAPPQEQARCGVEIHVVKHGQAYAIKWDQINESTYSKFMALPEDQALWIPLQEFNRLAAQSERLTDFPYTFVAFNSPTRSRHVYLRGKPKTSVQ